MPRSGKKRKSSGSGSRTRKYSIDQFLQILLDDGTLPGRLEWVDRADGMFRISWKQKSTKTWNCEDDAALFFKYEEMHGRKPTEGTIRVSKGRFRNAIKRSKYIEVKRNMHGAKTGITSYLECRFTRFPPNGPTQPTGVTAPQMETKQRPTAVRYSRTTSTATDIQLETAPGTNQPNLDKLLGDTGIEVAAYMQVDVNHVSTDTHQDQIKKCVKATCTQETCCGEGLHSWLHVYLPEGLPLPTDEPFATITPPAARSSTPRTTKPLPPCSTLYPVAGDHDYTRVEWLETGDNTADPLLANLYDLHDDYSLRLTGMNDRDVSDSDEESRNYATLDAQLSPLYCDSTDNASFYGAMSPVLFPEICEID